MLKLLKIPNQIIKGRLTPLKKVDFIVLHHMAHPTADVKTVEGWHIAKGWSAIGYNYWVGFDGSAYTGRGLNVSASVLGHNGNIVSVGFQGDYENSNKIMPDKQFNAGVEVIKMLKEKYPNAKIVGHKYFGGSVCPGRYFPLEEMAEQKKRGEAEMVYNYIDENMPEWARKTVQKLVNKGYLNGNEKGELGLTDVMLKLLVINDRAGVYGD